jgi:transcriptional regulator with XRE-family HTH domain
MLNSGANVAAMSEQSTRRGKVTPENETEAELLRALWEATYEERRASGVHSQGAFGERYGIGNQAAVGFFLAGKTALSLKAARGFAEGLGCSIADFSPRLAAEVEQLANVLPHNTEDRDGLGGRLRAARTNVGLNDEEAAAAVGVAKGSIGAWEGGRAVPDAIMLGRLAKVYEVTSDALLWDEAISMEAIRFAVQFDNLGDRQQRAFRAMWMAYFEQAKSDGEVEESFKNTPAGQELARNRATPAPPARSAKQGDRAVGGRSGFGDLQDDAGPATKKRGGA